METKIYFSCFILLSQLCGCTPKVDEGSKIIASSGKSNDYVFYGVNLIEWEDILIQKPSEYFSYIYSETCNYCQLIKDDIEKFCEKHSEEFYFVKYNSNIRIDVDYKKCIGANSIDKLSIKGTPTLFLINNSSVLDCFCGTQEITNFLNTY